MWLPNDSCHQAPGHPPLRGPQRRATGDQSDGPGRPQHKACPPTIHRSGNAGRKHLSDEVSIRRLASRFLPVGQDGPLRDGNVASTWPKNGSLLPPPGTSVTKPSATLVTSAQIARAGSPHAVGVSIDGDHQTPRAALGQAVERPAYTGRSPSVLTRTPTWLEKRACTDPELFTGCPAVDTANSASSCLRSVQAFTSFSYRQASRRALRRARCHPPGFSIRSLGSRRLDSLSRHLGVRRNGDLLCLQWVGRLLGPRRLRLLFSVWTHTKFPGTLRRTPYPRPVRSRTGEDDLSSRIHQCQSGGGGGQEGLGLQRGKGDQPGGSGGPSPGPPRVIASDSTTTEL